MVAKNSAVRSHIKAGIKLLLLRSDGQPRKIVQVLFHTFQHVAPLRKCAKKIVLSKPKRRNLNQQSDSAFLYYKNSLEIKFTLQSVPAEKIINFIP